ncbi:Nuclear transcription factor Y subunit A-7 [Vitis vinifera]|uniref:Nuclear transcription factor Y subunit A-7 n=1 Tax=Vitis vinifera TaxID=29760 RepID=A0A438IP24_VITVI|nr:Nuclear transcription factor Y subunit A-7 [Vitis vinifera]
MYRGPNAYLSDHAHCLVDAIEGVQAQAAYPYPDPYYRSIFAPYDAQPYPAQHYSGQPMVHLQLMGIQQAGVPLPSDAVEEPVFVNANNIMAFYGGDNLVQKLNQKISC